MSEEKVVEAPERDTMERIHSVLDTISRALTGIEEDDILNSDVISALISSAFTIATRSGHEDDFCRMLARTAGTVARSMHKDRLEQGEKLTRGTLIDTLAGDMLFGVRSTAAANDIEDGLMLPVMVCATIRLANDTDQMHRLEKLMKAAFDAIGPGGASGDASGDAPVSGSKSDAVH